MLGVRFLDVDFMRENLACASPTVWIIRFFCTVVKGEAAAWSASRSQCRMEAPERARSMATRAARPTSFCEPLYGTPGGGGLFGFKFSSRPHPRKFGVKRFLAVRRSWRGNGVDCFGLPPWKKFSAARPRPSRSAQEDGCSSLPCRGVLSFRSEAREASGSETARLHQARWRRSGGCMAARGARAAAGDADD